MDNPTLRIAAVVIALVAIVIGASPLAAQPAASSDPGEQAYTLDVVNESNQSWTAYVYQRQPDTSAANVFSVAWLASRYPIRAGDPSTGATSQWSATWDVKYGLVWSETGNLRPGVSFIASGYQPATPSGANASDFSVEGGPGLSAATKRAPAGQLVIDDGPLVPAGTFSVGLAMSGAGTHVVQAGPNLKHTFLPTPSYWVAAGQDVQVGDVLDIHSITPTSEVLFPVGVYHMIATLGADNQWAIVPR